MAPKDRLLEREAVLAQLDRYRRALVDRRGRMVLLRGEAGVGKSAVITRFIAGLGKQGQVLRGWCDPLAVPRPLGPVLDMLAPRPGDHATRLRAAIESADTEAIYNGLLRSISETAPLIWVIEDVHWADTATLDVLRFLARRIDVLPLLLVVSYRDDEVGDRHPLAALLGDLATSAHVSRIGLVPLSLEAVGRLAAGSGLNAETLFRQTGGNPFYVTEVLAAGAAALSRDGLPRSVSEAVWGRLARLSDAGRETAYAAAVCGARTDLALLHEVCSAAQVGLVECLGTGVLIADADTVGFRHELARRATLERVPAYQRRVLHKRALAALAEPPINPDMLAALAFHAEQAGDTDSVVSYAPAAAERASALGANREAAELYALALRHADTVAAERRATWLERHGFSGYLCGLGDAAVASWQEAIALRHALGDRLRESEDLHWLSHQVYLLGRTSEAVEATAASLRLLDDVEPCPQLAWTLATMASLAAFGFDPACDEYAARAVALGVEFADAVVVLRARFFALLAIVLRTDTGWDELEAVWRDCMAADQPELGGLNGGLICWFAAVHHRLDRAQLYFDEVSEFCATHDLMMFDAIAVGAAALTALHRGDWAHALDCANDVLTRPALPPPPRILPLITLALVRARRDEQPVATVLDEALAAADRDDLARLGVVWAARAEVAWLAGDDDTARAEAQAGLAAANEHADPWLVGPLRRWAYLAGGVFVDAPTPDTVTPYRFEVDGDWRHAAQEWTQLGCPYDAALAQLGGDMPAVQDALETFRRLGARAAARRARQRLDLLRGRDPDRRRKTTIAHPYGLTPRERDVLELIAAGLSDAEIASALVISPKTANRHVGAILAKLGARNRAHAAAAYASQLDPHSAPQ